MVEGALLVATVGCVVANSFEVVGKAVKARFVLRNSAEVGVQARWIPYLAVLEGAGVAGVVLGLFGVPFLGLAAAVGLTLFFVAAVIVHLRARVLHNIAFPLTFLGLAVATVAYFALPPG